MASQTVTIGEAIAEYLRTTPHKWPDAYGGAGTLDGHGIETKFFILPNINRSDVTGPRIYVAPVPTERLVDDTIRDRCNRLQTMVYEAGILKKLEVVDNDFEQPATLTELDDLIEFVEQLDEFFDVYKNDIPGCTVRNLVPELYQPEQLQKMMFWGFVRVEVRINNG